MSFSFKTKPKDRAGNRAISMVSRELIKAAILEKKRSNITQKEIAERLDVDKSQITKILSGKSNLTLRTMGEFLYALGWEFEFKTKRRPDFQHNQPKTERSKSVGMAVASGVNQRTATKNTSAFVPHHV